MFMGSPRDLYFLSTETKLVLPVLSCCLAQVAFLFGQGHTSR
jgi:hypothetical protein